MRTVLSIDKRNGYEVRNEQYCGQEVGLLDGECMEMKTAYTPQGDTIGDPALAEHLIELLGIVPELADTDHQTCSIGFSQQQQKWYGWSHRGMCAFGIGDRLFDPDYPDADDMTPFVERGYLVIGAGMVAVAPFADGGAFPDVVSHDTYSAKFTAASRASCNVSMTR